MGTKRAHGAAALACGDACGQCEGEAETTLHSIQAYERGRAHGAMANRCYRRGIEGKHCALLGLGEGNIAARRGGSTDAIQPALPL